MKKCLLTLVIASTVIFTVTAPVLAASDNAAVEQTYLARLDTYRASLQNWQTALQKYKDFNTLTAESAAIAAAKTYLTNSIDLVIGYLDILVQKANNTDSLSSNDKDYINNFYKSEKTYFATERQSLNNSATRDQVKAVSRDLDDHVKTETLPTIPLLKDLITTSLYKTILDSLATSFATTQNLAQNQNFLGRPTADLIRGWFTDAGDKINTSQNLLKAIITDLRGYKDGTVTGYDKTRLLQQVSDSLKTVGENLVGHANNILEILGRLKNG